VPFDGFGELTAGRLRTYCSGHSKRLLDKQSMPFDRFGKLTAGKLRAPNFAFAKFGGGGGRRTQIIAMITNGY